MDVVPDDVVLLLLQYCEVPGLLKFRQTCRRIYSISLAKQLWVTLYFRHVVGLNLPTPTYLNEIDSLSPTQLQAFVLHSLRLYYRTVLQPDCCSPTIVPFHRSRSVTWVRLIYSTWLLVASSDCTISSIALWSVYDLLLSKQSSKPVTEAYLEAPVSNGVIDIIDGHVFIALELRGRVPIVEVLTIMNRPKRPMFHHLQSVCNVPHIRFLRGSMIGASLHDNINVPCVLNWRHDITERLRAVPDLEGGSVAMHMEDDWIAVVRRQVVEVYILSPDEGGDYRFWRSVNLPHKVGSAAFSPTVRRGPSNPKSPLRLCIACDDGMFVYQLDCNISAGSLSLVALWHYTAPRTDKYIFEACQVSFGVTDGTVSWLLSAPRSLEQPVTFATARIPVGDSHATPPTFDWYDDTMPGQYCMGVRDYDESRGIAVFGNAFGELALYDFSGSDASLFDGAFRELSFTPLEDGDLLPTDPIASTPAPPFPYSGSFCLEECQPMIFDFWKSYRLVDAPDGWETDFKDRRWFSLFSGEVRVMSWDAWSLENASHYYGRPIPLLRKDCGWGDIIIFDAGGLLFLWNSEKEGFDIVHPGVTLEELTWFIDSKQYGLYQTSHCDGDRTQDHRGSQFYTMWLWEIKYMGRNGWQELHERGGQVHPDLLDNETLQQALLPLL
ncbi:unnamed protein product [Somion occarium]|uniref:F-box domain-containing protein n=1 Tax=Somion occarium TaxID=3059160 RepID=A0ABP1CRS4_9APHY